MFLVQNIAAVILLFYIEPSLEFYTNESPVKLLEVESLADRYPATESEYRTSVSNGFVRCCKILNKNSLNQKT